MKVFFAGLLLAASTAFAAHVSIGVNIGAPYGYYPPLPARVAYVPAPGPGYDWIDGYWYPEPAGWRWRTGYWRRPPYAGAYWVRPRFENRRFYDGYWGRQYRDRGDRRGYGFRR